MNSPKNSAIVVVTSSTTLDSVTATVSSPNEEVRRRLGTFFSLTKADEIQTLVPWLPSLAQYLEQTYYQILDEEPEASVERALGAVRQRAKLKLQQLTQATRTISLDGIHYCLGTLRGRVLSITHTGDVRVFLMHRRPQKNGASSRVQWIDVAGTTATRAGKQVRPLTSGIPTIVSGTIGDNDTIVVATESFIDVLGLPKVERTLESASL